MAVGNAFHKRNGLSEDAHVAFHDSVHIVGRRELAATERAEFEIRIYGRLRYHTAVDLQAFILRIIFRMFHSWIIITKLFILLK